MAAHKSTELVPIRHLVRKPVDCVSIGNDDVGIPFIFSIDVQKRLRKTVSSTDRTHKRGCLIRFTDSCALIGGIECELEVLITQSGDDGTHQTTGILPSVGLPTLIRPCTGWKTHRTKRLRTGGYVQSQTNPQIRCGMLDKDVGNLSVIIQGIFPSALEQPSIIHHGNDQTRQNPTGPGHVRGEFLTCKGILDSCKFRHEGFTPSTKRYRLLQKTTETTSTWRHRVRQMSISQ